MWLGSVSLLYRGALECAYARRTEIRPPTGRLEKPDVQGRLGCTRLVMVPQLPSAKNRTLQSDVNIPGERDRRYGSPPPKRSDDDDYNDDTSEGFLHTNIRG